jgi:hypothetical protein
VDRVSALVSLMLRASLLMPAAPMLLTCLLLLAPLLLLGSLAVPGVICSAAVDVYLPLLFIPWITCYWLKSLLLLPSLLLLSSLLLPVSKVHSFSLSVLCSTWTMEISISQQSVLSPTCLLYNKLSASGHVCSASACAIPGLACSVYQPMVTSAVYRSLCCTDVSV